ncbi:MAG TPA: S46 family peptidase, partial [Paludibacter sp.]|nr:S46 family peptidase [Paludibacter sp.]
HASLKDAVVVFGNGCTGVMVSNQGLLFTNHHCGYETIQQHSSVEHNYLKNGFTAEKLEDEIPSPGLTVKFLVRIEDMTERVLALLPETLTGKERADKLDSITSSIQKEAVKGTGYIAKLKPFYSGNQFYLFVFEEFTDIRFAYAPPEAIGKFGGDTDNWMWPRHTGDFSVFRVYCTPDGKPAPYSKDNVPYSPKKFATVSNKGYKPGDYTMIMGNPGTTVRYLTSWGIANRMNSANQAMIDVRGAKQDVWRSFMVADEAINIAYASKYARSSNYWKNSIGMNKAIDKLGVLDEKRKQEAEFTTWMNQTPERQAKYKYVLKTIEDSYNTIYPYGRAMNYLRESLLNGVEMPRMAATMNNLVKNKLPEDSLLAKVNNLYKDYNPKVDEATLVAMLDIYKKSVDADAWPEAYTQIQKKFKGDYKRFAQYLYKKSVFSTPEKITQAIKKQETDFSEDPALVFAIDVINTNTLIKSKGYTKAIEKLADAERLYLEGIMAMAAEKGIALYPDANSTMRLTYGTVGGYSPADAVEYNYYTTTKGILEKEVPGNWEFDVPPTEKKAIVDQDYAAYLDTKTGKMHVAFLSNNDITGGNSGSPIFNAKGELLGLAFDGNWEAMSGDIVFEPDLQRTINVDVRFIMFIMDKVGGATRLLNELSVK